MAVLFLGGLYFVLLSTINRVIDEDARLAAAPWSAYLVTHPDEVQRLQHGEGLSSRASQFFSSYALGQNIVGFRLFANGAVLFGMVAPELATKATSLAGSRSLAAASLLGTKLPLRIGEGPPLRLEVLSDQSARRNVFHDELVWAFTALSFLTACSFGVPALVFLHELAQPERGEEKMEFLAQHDLMTTLMNRTAFNSALERQLAGARKDEQTALHFIDLDRFKSVNDSLGHNVVDELIKSVAAKLQSVLGPRDFVARFGGDEFVMAQIGVQSMEAAELRALQIREAISSTMPVGDHHVRATASIGIAVAPRDGRSLSDLTRAADLALYSAKGSGRDTSRMYDPQMDVALQKRRCIEKSLLQAVACNGFDLHFQPMVEAGAKSILGFEVLLRLKSESGETLAPVDFIPVAEEMGLISHIGSWVIRKACAAAAAWPDGLTVAVNLSPRQFENGELCGIVEAALSDSGLDARRLELEITEGHLLTDTDRVIAQLRQLKSLGVSIAMDDFGTGYSSLSYLWRFPFDKLKIDRSFMRVLSEGDAQASSILNTIVALGRTLNLQVTAEGVETEEQARRLEHLNCDQLQGYHFGHPMPEAEIPATILRGARARAALDEQRRSAAATSASANFIALQRDAHPSRGFDARQASLPL